MEIRIFFYIALTIISLASCVEELPLQSLDEDMKLFVVCEMTVGDDIIADITFTGNTNGSLPAPLMRPDTFSFSLSEGEKDFGVPFNYDTALQKFYIKREQMKLITSEKYKFRGIGTNKNFTEPTIFVPEALSLDTIMIKDIKLSIVNGKYITQLECKIKINKPSSDQSYFHFIPVNENKEVFQVTSFVKDQSAFKRLKHRPGFLVDYSRITGDEMTFNLEISNEKASTLIDFSLYNTTKSFYEFNYYMSNNTGTITNESPPIAGFNIKSEKAYGTFSARSKTQSIVKFK